MKQHLSHTPGPIGVFDSGYGGLTILDKIKKYYRNMIISIWEIMHVPPMGHVLSKSYTNLPGKPSTNCLIWDAIWLY